MHRDTEHSIPHYCNRLVTCSPSLKRSKPLSIKTGTRASPTSLFQQECHYGAIHTAAQRAKDFAFFDFLPYRFAGFFNKGCRSPIAFTFANLKHKIAQNLFSMLGVNYFRMKLNAIKNSRSSRNAAIGEFVVSCNRLETGRDSKMRSP